MTVYTFAKTFNQIPSVYVTSALGASNFTSKGPVYMEVFSMSCLTNSTRTSVALQHYGKRWILACGY